MGTDALRLVATKFLSTLSLRRATRRVNLLGLQRVISIHALLAESDQKQRGPPA